MSKNKEERNKEVSEKEKDVKTKPIVEPEEAIAEEPAAEPTAEEILSELKDKHLRLQAEFDNYRRRTSAEKIDMIKTASESVISSLLPVIDDMERALAAFKKADVSVQEEEGSAAKPLADGVELIYNKLIGILKQRGVSECEVMDKPFNEDLAEAVAQIPAPSEDKKDVVLDVVQKGYRFDGGKVIRFAKVVVGC